MKRAALPLIAVALIALLIPVVAEAQQVYRDETSFMAAVGELALEGFESFPTDYCPLGGTAPSTTIQTQSFTVSTAPLDGGTSFLCVGTTSELDPRPTEGNNALVAGSLTFDRFELTFSLRKPTFAVGFYVTDAAETGNVLFSTDRGDTAVVAECCNANPATNVVFLGFVSDKPIRTFQLTNTGIGDGLGVDEVMLAVRGRSRIRR